jgi:hypothetical protein
MDDDWDMAGRGLRPQPFNRVRGGGMRSDLGQNTLVRMYKQRRNDQKLKTLQQMHRHEERLPTASSGITPRGEETRFPPLAHTLPLSPTFYAHKASTTGLQPPGTQFPSSDLLVAVLTAAVRAARNVSKDCLGELYHALSHRRKMANSGFLEVSLIILCDHF